jgi:hypothetical protein
MRHQERNETVYDDLDDSFHVPLIWNACISRSLGNAVVLVVKLFRGPRPRLSLLTALYLAEIAMPTWQTYIIHVGLIHRNYSEESVLVV